ncbi:hypothetical protein [Lactobacillus sp. CBA3605]|uniref:hypothetical protein n=1 Tax=Lactobacillus sp. CBA3605 TaxID=2099788 RepID=UPI001319E2FB|nr:hypothetical protein [Lactobacillus sp. CBA3605]
MLTEFFRFILLILMFLDNNPTTLLGLVFFEQVLAICSNLNFQNIVVHIINGNEELKTFNKDANTFSTIARLLVIPAYILLIKCMTNKEILLIDAVFTLISGLLILPVKTIVSFQKQETEQSNSQRRKIKCNKTTCLIFLLAMMSLMVGFSDSYSISYINLNSGTLSIGYALFVFIMTLAELLASVTSKQFDNIAEKDDNGSLIAYMSLLVAVLMFSVAVFHNVILFILVMAIGRVVYIWLQLFTLFWYQETSKQLIMNYVALQNVAVGSVTFFNSSIGALLIKSINIYAYLLIIGMVLLFAMILFKLIYRKCHL